MTRLNCQPILNGTAKSFLLLAFLCTANMPQLSAEETATIDTDDQPVAAKIPDVKDARAKPVVLRYQFHPNQFLHYEVVHEMVIEMTAKEVTEKTRNKSISKQHLRVVSVDSEGGAVIEPTLDYVRMTSQFDDSAPTEFDSDDPNKQPPQFAKVLESIGRPQGWQRLDALGNIVLGDDTSTSMNSSSLLIPLPEQAVEVGATWNEDYSVKVRASQKLERSIKLRRKFTLTRLEGDVASIEFKTVELDNPQDPEIRAQLIQMTPSGKVQFDVKAGKIVAKTMHSDKVEFDIAGGVMRAVSDRTEKLFTPKK